MNVVLIMVGIVMLLAALFLLITALLKRKRPKRPTARQDPLKFGEAPTFGPTQLGPGAIVSHGGVDYVVRGSVTYREGPFVWWEHLLEGGTAEPIWFSVEEDEGRLELVFWTKRADLALQPGGAHTVDGMTFHEDERGQASYTCEGTTGLPAGGQMSYVDYADSGRTALLSFEQWAPQSPWEISTGRIMAEGELTVYPAPPAGA